MEAMTIEHIKEYLTHAIIEIDRCPENPYWALAYVDRCHVNLERIVKEFREANLPK
jgi:hypothetical protein